MNCLKSIVNLNKLIIQQSHLSFILVFKKKKKNGLITKYASCRPWEIHRVPQNNGFTIIPTEKDATNKS